MNTATLTIQHSEIGVCHQVPVKDLGRATPAQLLAYLQRQGALPADDPGRPYLMIAEGKTLVPTSSFEAQHVTDKSVVTLVTRGMGAAPVPERRILDYQTMAASFPGGGRTVVGWRAFRSIAAAENGHATTDPAQAAVYHVWLSLASPVGWDSINTTWTVRLDASGAGFPREPPVAHFLAPFRPWNPHVRQADGLVCAGTLWLPSKLLAFYVLDILRVLNFDFGIDPREQLGHYQPRAVEWWRERCGGRPLLTGAYPTVVTPDVHQVMQDREDDPFGEIVSHFG